MLLGLPEFEFQSCGSVADAVALLSRHGEDARLLAGGTDLLILMKHRRAVPRTLIYIKRIPGLDHISGDAGGGLRIGGLVTARDLVEAPADGEALAILAGTAAKLGTTQIRNLGTIGGNLANASPSAEFAPALLTMDASVTCVGPGGERVIPLDEFFLEPGKSALARDEILTEIVAPPLPAGAKGIYFKHSLREMDVAMAAAAVLVALDGDECREIRIALGAVAPTPGRAPAAEAVLRGKRIDAALLDEVARVAASEAAPIDDIRAFADTRREAVRIMVRRGLAATIARARENHR